MPSADVGPCWTKIVEGGKCAADFDTNLIEKIKLHFYADRLAETLTYRTEELNQNCLIKVAQKPNRRFLTV